MGFMIQWYTLAMPAKRKITPLRAASEIRASAKKQVISLFDIFESWMDTLDSFRLTLASMRRDMKEVKKRQMQYFANQRDTQKRRKGGM